MKVRISAPSLLVLSLLLTGCQTSSEEQPTLLDNSDTGRTWHCYGKDNQPDWDCTEQAEPARIAAVNSVTLAPVVVAPVEEARIIGPDELVDQVAEEVAMVPAPARQADSGPQIVGSGAMILQQPAEGFAVQLLALQDEQRLLAFARRQGLETPLHARILSGGEPWYVLLLGLYPDRASAEAAKRNWVAGKTLELDPWVRTLGPLQTDIERALAAQLGAR